MPSLFRKELKVGDIVKRKTDAETFEVVAVDYRLSGKTVYEMKNTTHGRTTIAIAERKELKFLRRPAVKPEVGDKVRINLPVKQGLHAEGIVQGVHGSRISVKETLDKWTTQTHEVFDARVTVLEKGAKPKPMNYEELAQIGAHRAELERRRELANTERAEIPRRSEWFDVLLKRHFAIDGVWYPKGTVFSARRTAFSVPSYQVKHDKTTIASPYDRFNAVDFEDLFERHDKETREHDKEENAMGAELYGVFSTGELGTEEEASAIDISTKEHEYQEKIVRQNTELTEERARVKALRAQLEEQKQKYEVARREQVAEEYGIVTERHLWSVVIDVPMSWSKSMLRGDNEHHTEVLTGGRNMVEAAMAAEAAAKGIHEDAHVLSIEYNRNIAAIK